MKLRGVDQGESKNPAFPWSCAPRTLQKYVPFGRPLTCAVVGSGTSRSKLLNPDAMTVPNVALVPTSHD